mmetsp:Transcript_27674/g.40589  ORF Transcript_27674/g.40589 Transcript_27674/m.40589 type:complete len:130 (-) Transcript_27674:148-537(-)
MKLSTATIAIYAAAAAVSSVAAVTTSKASKSPKASRAGSLRGGLTTSAPSIDQTPPVSEPVHDPDPNPIKDCRPCNKSKTAGCPDTAGYCETTATFYPTRIDDPVTLTCEVCTDEGCPTIAIANCTDFL